MRPLPRPAIQIEGLDELRRSLRQAKDKGLNDEMKAIHEDLAEEITKRALPNVPVRTGALKASVRSAGTVRDAIGRAGKASVPYAAVVHWKYGPPFLTDAAAGLERNITERYESAIAEMFDKTIKGR